MVEVEQIFRIVLYIVLIIVALLFIYVFLWPLYQQSAPQQPHHNPKGSSDSPVDDDIPIDEVATEDDETKPQRQYQYDKVEQQLSLSDQPQLRISTLNYQEFVSVVFTDQFLNNYHRALRYSLTEKRKIYNRKLRQINSDLKNSQARHGNDATAGTHDSNLQRLRRASVEITQVLKAIEYRLSTLTVDQIKSDFHDLIYDQEFGLESLVGREDAKDIMALQIFTFARNPKLFFTSFQNITIYGRSGVGKSKLAETIGFVYAKSGILVRRKVRNVTKQEFTSSYVNEAAQLTRELLLSTLDGVLFIDEAYDLMPPKTAMGRGIDHGHEAVTELVNFLDKNIGLSIVIAAGYEEDMEERFIGANQGLDRRFPHKIRLKDYSTKHLTDILLKFMAKSAPQLEISDDDAGYLYTLIDFLYSKRPDLFSKQAGDMLILSSFLARSIYGSVTRYWIPGNNSNNAIMILDGFNDYLRDKGISISADPESFRSFSGSYPKQHHTPRRYNSPRNSGRPLNCKTSSNFGNKRESGHDPELHKRIDRLVET
jgi:hypothetical protein